MSLADQEECRHVPSKRRAGSSCRRGNYRSDNENRVAVAEWPDVNVTSAP